MSGDCAGHFCNFYLFILIDCCTFVSCCCSHIQTACVWWSFLSRLFIFRSTDVHFDSRAQMPVWNECSTIQPDPSALVPPLGRKVILSCLVLYRAGFDRTAVMSWTAHSKWSKHKAASGHAIAVRVAIFAFVFRLLRPNYSKQNFFPPEEKNRLYTPRKDSCYRAALLSLDSIWFD